MLDFIKVKTRKKKQTNIKCNTITQAYRSRCNSWKPSSKARIALDFPTFLRIQQGEVSWILKTMIPDYFLSSGATQ